MVRAWCVAAMMASLLCDVGAVPNPSGTCQANSDGSRRGYHSPAATDTYLPDCNRSLTREYWRVFARDDQQAYMIPRPDGAGLLLGICGSKNAALASLFRRYGFCEETVKDPSVVNNMAPEDALAIAHALHERLAFVEEQGVISPFAPDDDVLAACDLTNDASAQNYCDEVRDRCDSDGTCIEIGIIPGEAAAKVIAAALNKLYGIDSRFSRGPTDFAARGTQVLAWVGAVASLLLPA